MKYTVVTGLLAVTLAAGGCDTAATPSAATGPPSRAASASPASTANGVAGFPPAQIIQTAKAAVAKAPSFRMTVHHQGRGAVSDFRFAGGEGYGLITMDEQRMEMLSVAGRYYMRANEAYWTDALDGGAVNRLAVEKWFAVGAKHPLAKDFARAFDPARALDDTVKLTGAPGKVSQAPLDGFPVIRLNDSGDAHGAYYVATAGEPYLLEWKSAKNSGKIVGFGTTFPEIVAPAARDIGELPEKPSTA